jgi:hypothetical protein
MIAQQVGGKAARDAFFLSQFDVTSLPTMMVVSALVSIGVVRWVMGRAAGWLVPRGFAASGLLLLGEWALAPFQPRIIAVALYLHIAVFGSVLISGFWSLVTDRFDPHTARRRMGQIATGASVGAVMGGILVERVGAVLSVTAAFPVLAVLHLVCAGLVLQLRPSTPERRDETAEAKVGVRAGMEVLKRLPYLRNLAYLVFLGAVSAALIDYAFKAEVATSLAGGEVMMRFFALYYTAIGIVTLIVQSTLSRRSLDRLGLAGTSASLPATVVAGSVGMIVAPGLASALAARGAEAAGRSSLFRSGYELFYSPVAPRDKRAVKIAIDVLWERLGDVLGGIAAKTFLMLIPLAARNAILGLAALLGGLALWICHKLHRGYVEALEASLRRRQVPAEMSQLGVSAGSRLLQSQGQMQLHSLLFTVAGGLGSGTDLAVDGEAPTELMQAPGPTPLGAGEAVAEDPVARRLLALRSSDTARVRDALVQGPLDPLLAPQVIELLSRDEVAADAARALGPLATKIAGQLGDVLVDPERDFVARRRVPGILAASSSERAVGPLVAGLADRRFEVRYRCGRALRRLQSKDVPPALAADEIHAIVLEEVRVDHRVWEGQRQLDQLEPQDESEDSYFDDLLRRRAHRRLEHVFTLLGLTLPREVLQLAFRGLHTDDEHLKGTALEYLDSVLPAEIRERLWPYLTAQPAEKRSARPRDEIVADLMSSSLSIEMRLEELKGEEDDE